MATETRSRESVLAVWTYGKNKLFRQTLLCHRAPQEGLDTTKRRERSLSSGACDRKREVRSKKLIHLTNCWVYGYRITLNGTLTSKKLLRKLINVCFISGNVAEQIYRLNWALHVMKQKLDLYWNMRLRYGAVCHNI